MAPRRTGNNGKRAPLTTDGFQSVLNRENRGSSDKLTQSQADGLAKLFISCIHQKAGLYVSVGRYGTVNVKIYDGDDKYAEVIELSDQTEELCEELIEALWSLDQVSAARQLLPARATERAAAGRRAGNPTAGVGEGGVGPQGGS